MADVDDQLRLLRRQYLQLFEPDFLAWPNPQLLRRADAQAWLFKHLFDEDRNRRLPPERYQLRVLRPLIARIEKSIEDPDEDVGGIVIRKKNFLFFFLPRTQIDGADVATCSSRSCQTT